MTGPVQVLVVGFDHPDFSGEVLAELATLKEAGVVQLLDLVLVSRSSDGSFETMSLPEGVSAWAGDLVTSVVGTTADDDGAPEDEEARAADGSQPTLDGVSWSLSDVVPPGSVAAVALIEHLWAAPLVDAIDRSGGRALEETWLARSDVTRLAGLTRPGATT